MSSSLKWKCYVLIWLNWNFTPLLKTSIRSWIKINLRTQKEKKKKRRIVVSWLDRKWNVGFLRTLFKGGPSNSLWFWTWLASTNSYQIFYDLDLLWGSQTCWNHKLHIVFLDSCPLRVEHCMVATYIKTLKHSMLCVTGVYLGDITDTFRSRFSLECETSERLLFLFSGGLIARRKNNPSHRANLTCHRWPVVRRLYSFLTRKERGRRLWERQVSCIDDLRGEKINVKT